MKSLGVRNSVSKVYVLGGSPCEKCVERCELVVSIEHARNLTPELWRDLVRLQGGFAAAYLRLRYARSDAWVLVARSNGVIAHLQWIVPAAHIRRRYPFVMPGQWAVISCLTTPAFRGLGIYPAMLQRVMRSAISNYYFIWADIRNNASIRGIEAAGGKYVGTFTQRKYLKGLLSIVTYNEAAQACE